MLKFSKINILITTLLSIIVIFFTISNFTEFEDEFVNKKINLGLDLQGGSYLLLKIDNDPVIIKELQNKAISLKNVLKENNITSKGDWFMLGDEKSAKPEGKCYNWINRKVTRK